MLATVSQVIIFRHMGLDVPIHSNLVVSNWLTVVSIVRSYAIRRFFNSQKQSKQKEQRQPVLVK